MENITWQLFLDLDPYCKSLLHFDGVDATTNEITNPSFEVDLTGWTIYSDGDGTIARSSDHAVYGSWGCKLTATTGTQNLLRYPITFDALTTYRISAHFYITEITGTAIIRWFDGTNYTDANLDVTKLNQWQGVILTFTTGASPTSGWIDVPRILGAGTIYTDGVLLVKATNLIPDPSFETGITHWYGITDSDGTFSQSGAYAKDGTKSLKIQATTGSYSLSRYYITFEPSTTYTISAWFYITSITGTAIIRWFDGTNYTDANLDVTKLNQWQGVILTFTTGASPTSGWIDVPRILGFGTIYTDSVLLVKNNFSVSYFDGSFGTDYSWSGTAHASTSIKAATPILDEKSRYWAPHGNVQISNTQSRYGSSSGLFDGTGDYLSTAASADFDFGTGDWTIDFWVMRDGDLDNFNGFFSAALAAQNGWNICSGNGATANKVRIASKASGAWVQDIVSSSTLADKTWTHVVVERSGNTLGLWINGTFEAVADVTGYNYDSAGTGADIGRRFTDEDDHYFKGWIDEMRISKGVARYVMGMNFTLLGSAYDLWTDATSDVLLNDAPLTWSGGTQSTLLTALLADPGTIQFALDNGLSNSAHLYGYYSPGHSNCRAGFGRGARVKLNVVWSATTYYQGVWWILNDPQPTAGLFGPAITVVKGTDWLGVAQNMSLPTLAAQSSKRIDQLVPVLLAACPTQPPGLVGYTANGDTIFQSAFDKDNTLNDSVYSVLSKLCRSEFGRIYLQPGTAEAHLECENRNWRAGFVNGLATLSDNMDGLEILPDQNYYDTVKVTINPRRLSSGNVTLATYSTRLQLAPNETKQFDMFYTDPTSGDRVSGTNIVNPLVAGTHYKFGSVSDGVAQDLNAYLTATLVTVGANSTTISLHNTGSIDGYVNLLILQGLAIYTSDPYTATSGSGLRTLTFDMPYQSNPQMADAICTYLYNIVTAAGYRGMRVDIHANKSNALMYAALHAGMSRGFRVSESMTGTSGLWWVNGYQMTLGPGGRLDASWWMVPYTSETVNDIAPLIEIVQISTAADTGNGYTSLTWSHNNTGDKLVVTISLRGPTDPTGATATYGGVSMTRVVEHVRFDGTSYYYYSAIFYLASPGSGAHDVVISWSGTHFGGGCALSLTHCTGYSGGNGADGSSTTPSVTITSAAGNLVVDAMACGLAAGEDASVGAGHTAEEYGRFDDGASHYVGSGTSVAAGAASVAMNWTVPVAHSWSDCGVSLTGG